MSWFEKLSGGVKLVSKAIVTHAKAVGTGVGIGTAAIAKPKETAVIVGAMAATAVVGPQALLQAGKALLPRTLKGKVAAVAIGIPAAQILVGSPKAREAVVTAGTTFIKGDVAMDVAKVIEGEVSPLSFIKEHPVITTAAGLIGAVAVSKAIPAGAAFIAGQVLAKDKTPVDSRIGNVPVTTGTELIKTPMASPSAPVQTPGVTAPIAIPSGVATKRRATRKTVAKRGYPSHISGRLNLKWRSGICQ